MDRRLLEILVCPLCKGELIHQKERRELICRADRLAFPIRDDIPVMLVEESEAPGGSATAPSTGSAAPPAAKA